MAVGIKVFYCFFYYSMTLKTPRSFAYIYNNNNNIYIYIYKVYNTST